MKYWAKNGFYSRDVHGNHIPKNAVEITDEEHRDLIAAQSAGKQIKTGKDGKPVAADPPPRKFTEAGVRAEAARRMDAIVAGYTRQERETWSEQVRQAEAFRASGTAGILLSELADARGISPEEMVDRIERKRDEHQTAVARILRRQEEIARMKPIPDPSGQDWG